MAISRISRVRNCAVFHNFTWPANLPDFGRYNLIYGWNWSGKTTLSRLFRAFEMRTLPTNGQVTFSINGHDVTGDNFAQATLPVRVFNRDFMEESVFPVTGGDVPPIFVVGPESVEKQKEVERLNTDLTQAQKTLESARLEKAKANKGLDKYCIDRASVIKSTLRSPGDNPYNNYDKADYRSRAMCMADAGDAEAHVLCESDRDRLLAQHQATPKPEIKEISYQPPNLATCAEAVSQLLEETVISVVIKALKDDPPLASWVHQGLELHQTRNAKYCLFCEQLLPPNRLAALEAHFSAEYEEFLNRLDTQITELETAANATTALSLPNPAEFYDDLADEYKVKESAFRGALGATKIALDSLADALKDKKTRPFASVDLTFTVPKVDYQTLDRVNAIIRKHNNACDSLDKRATEARSHLEADSVATTLDDFNKMLTSLQEVENSVNRAEAEAKRLRVEIDRLEGQIVEHRQPAEELNEDLQKYLDHGELHLDIRDTGYAITRNGVPATALSEGETTAIALLYFLKSLKDRRFDLAKGVVVLDDPVSSLDANALYLAFGLIRERTQDAAQLFIFTHNFTFFRQVRNWFHNLKGQGRSDISQRPARFYMLDCTDVGSQRCSEIKPLDPLLEQYDSEYHYLFARIYRAANISTQGGLEENYIFPNMARRLLETFLAFRQPQLAGGLGRKIEAVQFDESKKLRILRFVHTYSHSGAVGEPEHDPSLLGEARAVLNDLLDLIRSQDADHFSAMEQLVSPHTDEGTDE